MNYKEILFFKKCSEQVSPQEEEYVQEHLSSSEKNRQEMEVVKEIVSIENEIKELSVYNIPNGYEKLTQKIKKENMRYRKFLFFLIRSAAILTIPLLISTLVLLRVNQDQREKLNGFEWMEVSAAPGLISKFELPDHSVVWLNSGSTLRYPSRFTRKEREVKLEGEGYFDVKSDRTSPFYVTTSSGMKVIAYGTQFNVNAYQEYDEIETVLVEGKVDICFSGDNLSHLKPGERAVFNKKNYLSTVMKANIDEKIAWKEGKVLFRNASLEDVFQQLSRHYNVDIIFHDDYKLSSGYRCRVTFTNETIQQIFSYLEKAIPIKWKVSTPVQKEDSTLLKQQIDVWLNKK